MSFTIKLSGHEDVNRMLTELGENATHATRLSMNMLGEHMQFAMRAQIPKKFQFRGTEAGFSRSIVLQKASQGQMKTVAKVGPVFNFKRRTGIRDEAVLKVGSDQGGTKATATRNLGVILARHEEAGSRKSGEAYRAGKKTFIGGFFIPAKGLRTNSANPPRSLYPKAIGVKMQRAVDGKPMFAKSKRKTTFSRKTGQLKLGESFYAIEGVGIFRRRDSIGPKMRGQRGEPIWWFNRGIRTPARLGMWDTAQVIYERFAYTYAMQAIETVVKRGG
jgi:hypothetical protein